MPGPREPEYRLYDPANPTVEDLGILKQLKGSDRSQPMVAPSFPTFAVVTAEGFTRVTYRALWLEGSGTPFWFTRERGRKVGQALVRNLASLGFEVSEVERDALQVMADAVRAGVTVGELTLCHKSEDQATPEEGRGLAALATKLSCRAVHWWANGFEAGAVQAFCDRFLELENRALTAADVCDTARPEPHDKVALPALAGMLEANAKAPRATQAEPASPGFWKKLRGFFGR